MMLGNSPMSERSIDSLATSCGRADADGAVDRGNDETTMGYLACIAEHNRSSLCFVDQNAPDIDARDGQKFLQRR